MKLQDEKVLIRTFMKNVSLALRVKLHSDPIVDREAVNAGII